MAHTAREESYQGHVPRQRHEEGQAQELRYEEYASYQEPGWGSVVATRLWVISQDHVIEHLGDGAFGRYPRTGNRRQFIQCSQTP